MEKRTDQDCNWGTHKEIIERNLRTMKHDHVSRCYGFFSTDTEDKLVLERMDYSLRDVIGVFSLIGH